MSNIEINSKNENNNYYNMINEEEDNNNDQNFKTIIKLMNMKKINLNNNAHLKYMLSLTLKEDQKGIDFKYLLSFLLKYKNKENEDIFYEYFFQCCELGKLNYISLLLNNQISVNAQNEIGETPMHIAIAKKDIDLIKLLIEFNPNLSIVTYEDKLSCYNYADNSENEEIKTIIYNKINSSKEIKSKLKSFINNMENLEHKNSINSVESGTKEVILNYCGETYKSSNKTDDSEIKTSEEEPIKINDIVNNQNNNNIQNGYILDSKAIFDNNVINNIYNNNIQNDFILDNNIYIKKISQTSKDMPSIENNDKDLFLNKHEKKTKSMNQLNIVYQKKKIGLSKSENSQYKFLTEKKTKKQNGIFADFDIKRNILNSQSLSNKNSDFNNNINKHANENENKEENKNKEEKENKNNNINKDENNNDININKITNNKDSKDELEKFFIDINLPKEYSQKFIDNGFDDLNLLKEQTKSGIALSNQNLKDIGITSCGERAKILIHLEEKAEVIKYLLEKNKIYIKEEDAKDINKKKNSLFKFLNLINLEQYEKNFRDNGYYTSELLFTQMLTRQPINEEILKNELKIEKKGHRLILYNNLVNRSKDYAKSLKNKVHTKTIYDGPALKSCEPCCIY